MTTTTSDSKVLTVPEAAKVLGIGRNLAYEAARAGNLPTLKFGNRLVVPVAALERLLDSAGRKAS